MKSVEMHQKRVAIWLRVSTEDQVRGESPETHERRARAYAESKDWTVAEVYRLDAVSGKTINRRVGRKKRQSGSEGGATELNPPFPP